MEAPYVVEPSSVSAVVVTRGDVDLTPILNDLAEANFAEVVVWRNGDTCWNAAGREPVPLAAAPDLKVYGRYAAIQHTVSEFVYVQDDDCLIPVHALLRHPDSVAIHDGVLVANMPLSRWDDYPDSALVGWGSLFHRDLPFAAFGHFLNLESSGPWTSDDAMLFALAAPSIEYFLRACDVPFSALTPHLKVDVGFSHLPWAEDPARAMFKQPGHKAERDAILSIARARRAHAR